MTRALRHAVPVDDTVHEVVLAGPILHVDCRDPAVVDVWTQDEGRTRTVRLLVVGTGQPWPDGAIHFGTALTPGTQTAGPFIGKPRGRLVWHLLGLPK